MRGSLQRNRLGSALSAGMPELDDLFKHFFRAEDVGMWRAPASIWEADNMFHIEIDAPGVKKEDVELTFDKGSLQVTLERKAPEGERTVFTVSVGPANSVAVNCCVPPVTSVAVGGWRSTATTGRGRTVTVM